MQYNILNLFLIVITSVSAFNLLLISFYSFIIKRKDKSFFWIGIMCLAILTAIIDNLLVYLNNISFTIFHISLFLNLSLGAFLFFLITLFKNYKILHKHYLLFLPSVIYVLVLVLSLVFQRDNIAFYQLISHNPNSIIVKTINYFIILLGILINSYLLITEILGSKNIKYDVFRKYRLEILISFLFFQIISYAPYLIIEVSWKQVFIMPISALIFYLWAFFRLLKILEFVKKAPKNIQTANIFFSNKYKNLKVCNEKQEKYVQLITSHLETKKPYLESKYSLICLSNEIGLSHHIVSMVINDKIGLTFHELLNKYRIEEAINLILNEKNPKVEAIAYSCGFGNKASFYSAFKKHVNVLPKDFIKKHKCE